MTFDKATRAHGIAAKLAAIAEHASDVRLTIVLSLLTCFAAPIWTAGLGDDLRRDFFAVGSTLFSYLLLRGRTVPVPLAWLGVPGTVNTSRTDAASGWFMSMPMLLFEVALGLWLIIKGVAAPATHEQTA